jgi:uncharacterized membrane protein YphA (DoxX/SURF4 family)
MNFIQRLELWGDNHHPKWLDYIRIALGLFLCYKAITFLINMSYLVGLMNKANMGVSSFMVIMFGQFIIIVTLMSGILLILGLHTRIICLVQIPILISALVLLNRSGSGAVDTSELFLTILTLILLIGFLVVGNGPLSYSKLFREEDKTYRDEHKQQA